MGVGARIRDFFRYAVLVNLKPRPLTAEFLDRPDTEWRRILRLLPYALLAACMMLPDPVDRPPGFGSVPGEEGSGLLGIAMSALAAGALLAGLNYGYAGLVAALVGGISKGWWARSRSAISLNLYAGAMTTILLALAGGALLAPLWLVSAAYGVDELWAGIATAVLAVVYVVLVAISYANVFVMVSEATGRSVAALFWTANAIPTLGVGLAIATKAAVRAVLN